MPESDKKSPWPEPDPLKPLDFSVIEQEFKSCARGESYPQAGWWNGEFYIVPTEDENA